MKSVKLFDLNANRDASDFDDSGDSADDYGGESEEESQSPKSGGDDEAS